MTDIETHLREALETLPGLAEPPRIEVEASNSLNFVASIEAQLFQGLEEWKRQEMVWEHLRGRLSEDEAARVEFVSTHAPGESAAA